MSIFFKPPVDSGVIADYQGGLLKPYDTITRVEVANLVGKIFPPAGLTVAFKDEIPAWATGINAAVASRVLTGYPDRTFKPDQPITKSEVLILLQRTIESYKVK